MHGSARATVVAGLVAGFVLVTAAFAASSGPSSLKVINAKIESKVIGSVPLTSLSRNTPPFPIWCFDKTPAFAFVRDKNAARVTFDGSVEEIMRVDARLQPRSLECSDNGDVVTAFAGDGAKFFIRKGDRFGTYKTSGFEPLGISSKGHLLSPTGDTLVTPVDLSYESGDDVLSTMRVVRLRGESVSWRGDEVDFFDPQVHAMRSYSLTNKQFSTLLEIGERYRGEDYSVGGIANCARHRLLQIASHLPHSGSNASADRLFIDILKLNPTIAMFAARGESGSVTLNGSNFNSMCIVTDTTGAGGPEESYRYFLLFDDGVVKYSPPAGVFLGYAAQVAPRGCLVLARQWKGDGSSGEFVAALRITRAGRCAP
jgi:hypothetical protein